MFEPQSSIATGYHLFLMPSGQLFNELKTITKTFDPHVTLLAGIPKTDEAELIAKIQKLASFMKPFEIELGDIATEDAYFRALYLKVKPNPLLKEYHQKALEIFDMDEENAYMPHLSLYYGNVTQSAKDEMIKSLVLPENMKFLVDRIYLYHTEGQAQDWARAGEYVLGQ